MAKSSYFRRMVASRGPAPLLNPPPKIFPARNAEVLPPQEVVETKYASRETLPARRDFGKTIPRNPESVIQEQPPFAPLAKTSRKKTTPTSSEAPGLTKLASAADVFIAAPITEANRESAKTTRMVAPGSPLVSNKTAGAQKVSRYPGAADQISGIAQTRKDKPPDPKRSAVMEATESLQRPETVSRYKPPKAITKPWLDSLLVQRPKTEPKQQAAKPATAALKTEAPREILRPPPRPAVTSSPASSQTKTEREAPRIEIGTVEVRVTEPEKPARRKKAAARESRSLTRGLAVPFGIGQG